MTSGFVSYQQTPHPLHLEGYAEQKLTKCQVLREVRVFFLRYLKMLDVLTLPLEGGGQFFYARDERLKNG